MNLLTRPGASLLIVGLLLMFVVVPIIDAVPLVGGLMQTMAFVIGALGIIGGAYLLVRSLTGIGR